MRNQVGRVALALSLALGGLALSSAPLPALPTSSSDTTTSQCRGGSLDFLANPWLSVAEARVGGQPPSFTLPAAVGGPSTGQFRMGDLIGHNPVVILFWATWCVPCTQELPFYQGLFTRYQAQGLRVVGISMDNASTVTRVGPAARRLGVTYDIVTDLDTRVTSQLNPRRSAPFSVWVNREGRITWEREGFAPAEQRTIEDGVRALVQ